MRFSRAWLGLLASQLLLGGMAAYWGVPRPLIAVELLLWIALVCWRRIHHPLILTILVMVYVSMEVLLFVSSYYIAYSPLQLLHLTQFVTHLQPQYLWSSLWLIPLLAGFYLCVKPFGAVLWRQAAWVLGVCALINGVQSWCFPDQKFRIVGSLTHALLERQLDHMATDAYAEEFYKLYPWTYKTSMDYAQIEQKKPEKVLLVVVESWGWPKRTEELSAQWQTLKQQDFVHEWSEHQVVAKSGTMVAEVRELCHSHADFMQLASLQNGADLSHCWPNRFKQQGFQIMAFHGARKSMYNRSQWYPLVGFPTFIGRSDRPNLKECYSFPGWCDQVVMTEVLNSLHQPKAFTYWLTLNSHSPYDERDIHIDRTACVALGLEGQRCHHFLLQKQWFDQLAQEIKAQREALQGVTVILVGDHWPPLLQDDFLQDRVPAVVFKVQ